MTAWNHVGLLKSKDEMIYLPKKVSLIIIHTNKPIFQICSAAISIGNKGMIMKILKYICLYTICMLLYCSL